VRIIKLASLPVGFIEKFEIMMPSQIIITEQSFW